MGLRKRPFEWLFPKQKYGAFFSVDALFTYNSSPTTLYQDCSALPSPAVLLYSKNKHTGNRYPKGVKDVVQGET
jgi:hypothetical protein